MKKDNILCREWDESYSRSENFAFYPKEESVKFLNRFVRKRVGIDKFKDILDLSKKVRGLDFGCGIGRMTILMREFGIDAYGVDISRNAIVVAKKLARHFRYTDMRGKFSVMDGKEIPFPDSFFDITISEGVLDSMDFGLARKLIKEIDRVTKKLLFLSLISGEDGRHPKQFCGQEIVNTKHENGTIQSYFNCEKIKRLIKGTKFTIETCHLIQDKSLIPVSLTSRYYIVLRKKE